MTVNRSVHIASTHGLADARIVDRECMALVESGYEVSLIVPAPTGSSVSGIKIISVPPATSGRNRILSTIPTIYRAAKQQDRASVLHFHDAELLPVMLLLAARGRRVIYDAHENTPLQALNQHWIPRPLRRPVSWFFALLEWLGGRRFEAIIAAEPGIAARYPAEKTTLVRNFPRTELFEGANSLPYAERENVVSYVGSIARKRGVIELVQAIGLISNPGASLNLCGPFHPAGLEQELATVEGWDKVVTTGWIDRQQVATVLGESRVGMVVLHPISKYLDAYPSKLFEYMAAGLPIVASDFPLWRNLIDEYDCALFVDPLRPEEIANAIGYLLDNPDDACAMGARGRLAARKFFDWSVDAPALLGIYKKLFSPNQTPVATD